MTGIQYELPKVSREYTVDVDMEDDLNNLTEESADNTDTDAIEEHIQIVDDKMQELVEN